MGKEKEFLIKSDDYYQLIHQTLCKIDAIRFCPNCHVEYLTGKDESLIYATVTNVFKERYEKNYDNQLMKKLVKKILDERFFGHKCEV